LFFPIFHMAIESERLELGARKAGEYVQGWFEKRAARGKLSKVHDWQHVRAVARHARAAAEELALNEGFSPEAARQLGIKAETAGYLHDIVRRNTELKPHGTVGEALVNKIFRTSLGRVEKQAKGEVGVGEPRFAKGGAVTKREPPFSDLTAKEMAQISSAVGLHEADWKTLEDKVKPLSPEARIIAQALVAGDKIFEASGHRVLERRSFFVGKERMEKDLA
jgi:hypothetical protein